MALFIKVLDNVKKNPNNQFLATFFFFNTKHMVENVYPVEARGGSSWTPVTNFGNYCMPIKLHCISSNLIGSNAIWSVQFFAELHARMGTIMNFG